MKSQTVKLPAFLASALVNGDTSGLTCSCAPGRASPDVHYAGDCDFRWLAVAHKYVAPGHVASTACTCGAAYKDPQTHCAPGCGEAYFSWSCDLPGFNLGADVMDYVVLYPEGT